MKKVFKENDPILHKREMAVLYSEEYEIDMYIHIKDDFWNRIQVYYRCASKNSHKAVIKKCKKDYPGCRIINCVYQ